MVDLVSSAEALSPSRQTKLETHHFLVDEKSLDADPTRFYNEFELRLKRAYRRPHAERKALQYFKDNTVNVAAFTSLEREKEEGNEDRTDYLYFLGDSNSLHDKASIATATKNTQFFADFINHGIMQPPYGREDVLRYIRARNLSEFVKDYSTERIMKIMQSWLSPQQLFDTVQQSVTNMVESARYTLLYEEDLRKISQDVNTMRFLIMLTNKNEYFPDLLRNAGSEKGQKGELMQKFYTGLLFIPSPDRATRKLGLDYFDEVVSSHGWNRYVEKRHAAQAAKEAQTERLLATAD